jgi:hypothetical protein
MDVTTLVVTKDPSVVGRRNGRNYARSYEGSFGRSSPGTGGVHPLYAHFYACFLEETLKWSMVHPPERDQLRLLRKCVFCKNVVPCRERQHILLRFIYTTHQSSKGVDQWTSPAARWKTRCLCGPPPGDPPVDRLDHVAPSVAQRALTIAPGAERVRSPSLLSALACAHKMIRLVGCSLRF